MTSREPARWSWRQCMADAQSPASRCATSERSSSGREPPGWASPTRSVTRWSPTAPPSSRPLADLADRQAGPAVRRHGRPARFPGAICQEPRPAGRGGRGSGRAGRRDQVGVTHHPARLLNCVRRIHPRGRRGDDGMLRTPDDLPAVEPDLPDGSHAGRRAGLVALARRWSPPAARPPPSNTTASPTPSDRPTTCWCFPGSGWASSYPEPGCSPRAMLHAAAKAIAQQADPTIQGLRCCRMCRICAPSRQRSPRRSTTPPSPKRWPPEPTTTSRKPFTTRSGCRPTTKRKG